MLVPTDDGAGQASGGGFLSIVLGGGIIGILNWAGIFFWTFVALPLGLWSIVCNATLRTARTPLATKLLMCGAGWVFILGWVGAAQGTIGALSALGCGTPDVEMLAQNISQALFSVAGALTVCQAYVFFIVVSVVTGHARQRSMTEVSQQARGTVPTGAPGRPPAIP